MRIIITMIKRIIRAMLMASIMIVGSKAQLRGCWNRIGACITRVEVEDVDECCPDIKAELFKDRECFCSIRTLADRNSTTKRGLSTLLSICDIASSFDSLCPDVRAPPPTSTQSPPSESDDPFHTPPETTSASPPYPRSPPKLDSEPSPNNGISGPILAGVIAGSVILLALILIIIGIILHRYALFCGCFTPNNRGDQAGNLPIETLGGL